MRLNKMKITSNDIYLFEKVGNIFPSYLDLQSCLSNLPLRTKLLLSAISNGEIEQNSGDINISFIIEYLSKSYNKRLSSFIDTLLESFPLQEVRDYYVLSTDTYEKICALIDVRYYIKWTKLLETFKLKYNAIRPYDMEITDNNEETTDNDVLISRVNESSSSSSSNDKVIQDITEDSIYGFNSVSPVPTDKSTNQNEVVGTDNDTYSGTGSTDTQQDKTINSERNIKRLGNIGNITQQELIERERELWQYQIIDVVYKDLDKIFTCGSY